MAKPELAIGIPVLAPFPRPLLGDYLEVSGSLTAELPALSLRTRSRQRPADPERDKGQHRKNQERADDSELPNGATLGERKLSAGAGFYIAYYEVISNHCGLPCQTSPVKTRAGQRPTPRTHTMPPATDFRCQAVPTTGVRDFPTNLRLLRGGWRTT
jgi:hypothetical protein